MVVGIGLQQVTKWTFWVEGEASIAEGKTSIAEGGGLQWYGGAEHKLRENLERRQSLSLSNFLSGQE
jgi:hypothetical protein